MRRGYRLPVDYFFRSLAHDQAEHAIGIILSGNGTDGTLGIRAIKEAGGLWNPDLQLWAIRYDRVATLGLKNRIVEDTSC